MLFSARERNRRDETRRDETRESEREKRKPQDGAGVGEGIR